MRGIWAGGPGLVLGLLVAAAPAEDVRWRPAASASVETGQATPIPSPGPAASLGRPMTVGVASSPSTDVAPVASLGRPLPAGARTETLSDTPALLDPGLYPVSYSPALGAPVSMTARAKGPDAPQPMPAGEPVKGPPLIETPLEEQYNDGVVTKPPAGGEITVVPAPAPGMLADPIVSDGGGVDEPWADGSFSAYDEDGCCPYRFWVSGAYLFWNIRDSHTPPLVTTSPPASGGRLDEPDTVVLFGGSIDHEDFSGGRLTAGLWLDAERCYGLEGSAFFLAKRTVNFSAASGGDPVLARPVIDATTGAETVLPFGLDSPPWAISASATSELWGAELNGLLNLQRGSVWELSLLGGFRYLRLREELDIREQATLPEISALAADLIEDSFATHNEFYGGQVGLRSEWCYGNLRLDLTGQVALGDTHEVVDISFNRVVNPALPGFIPSGLLAAPTNAGHYTRDRFAVVPQVGLNVGYQITDHWRAFVGYDFLYWSKVARPGDQIDRVVNLNQVAGLGTAGGPARPAFNFNDTAFWAQGASAGVEFRY